MPSYDYRCGDCRQEFTVERSMKDESKQHCLGCGSGNANRIWTAFFMASNGSTQDYGQGCGTTTTSAPAKSGCGACVSKACGSCH